MTAYISHYCMGYLGGSSGLAQLLRSPAGKSDGRWLSRMVSLIYLAVGSLCSELLGLKSVIMQPASLAWSQRSNEELAPI